MAITLTAAALLPASPAVGKQDPFEPNRVEAPQVGLQRARVDAPVQSLGNRIGRIRIPTIGLDTEVRAGVALSVIDQGPAHWIGTANPGQAGNMVIAGHRTTHSAPFRHLDSLDPGDLIYVTGPRGRDAIYRVRETFIVDPTDIWIADATSEAILTMFACHPLGSAAQRIVVRADLLGGGLIA